MYRCNALKRMLLCLEKVKWRDHQKNQALRRKEKHINNRRPIGYPKNFQLKGTRQDGQVMVPSPKSSFLKCVRLMLENNSQWKK